MKCKDCQNYNDYYGSCSAKRIKVNPSEERKCEQLKEITSREIWIAREEWGDLHIYLVEPHFDGKWGRECWTTEADAPAVFDNCRSISIPSYLYPEITFENSPQKLIIGNGK